MFLDFAVCHMLQALDLKKCVSRVISHQAGACVDKEDTRGKPKVLFMGGGTARLLLGYIFIRAPRTTCLLSG